MFRKTCSTLLVLAALAMTALAGQASAETLINGAGATFPYPLYSKWFSEYAKVDPSVKFNYQSIGSGGGIKQILAQTVDFGATDKFLTDEQLKSAPGKILHIPTVMGAVVVTYNIPGIGKGLKMTPDVLADIYLGKITKWNDPRIASVNKTIKLPANDIVVVHRSDGSGTSAIFTDYLSNVSAEWKNKVGMGASVNWPVGLGGKGNEGVAGQIKNVKNSIGYVELAYAHENKLPYASLKNASGSFVEPTPAAEECREWQEAGRVPQLGTEKGAENGSRHPVRPASREGSQNGREDNKNHQILALQRGDHKDRPYPSPPTPPPANGGGIFTKEMVRLHPHFALSKRSCNSPHA
ncbi:MAG: phosphate transporter substrate-binding protein, PhoT family [Geobacteraceae bacterium]|nr:phosphate transporter substrate-binding protein, PhoT family [Geobacteraceae bacterium]